MNKLEPTSHIHNFRRSLTNTAPDGLLCAYGMIAWAAVAFGASILPSDKRLTRITVGFIVLPFFALDTVLCALAALTAFSESTKEHKAPSFTK